MKYLSSWWLEGFLLFLTWFIWIADFFYFLWCIILYFFAAELAFFEHWENLLIDLFFFYFIFRNYRGLFYTLLSLYLFYRVILSGYRLYIRSFILRRLIFFLFILLMFFIIINNRHLFWFIWHDLNWLAIIYLYILHLCG